MCIVIGQDLDARAGQPGFDQTLYFGCIHEHEEP
jgi:hypothetical protein